MCVQGLTMSARIAAARFGIFLMEWWSPAHLDAEVRSMATALLGQLAGGSNVVRAPVKS